MDTARLRRNPGARVVPTRRGPSASNMLRFEKPQPHGEYPSPALWAPSPHVGRGEGRGVRIPRSRASRLVPVNACRFPKGAPASWTAQSSAAFDCVGGSQKRQRTGSKTSRTTGVSWKPPCSFWTCSPAMNRAADVDRERIAPSPPPKPDRRFSRIRLSSSWSLMDWLRHSTPGFQKSRTSRAGSRLVHRVHRRSTVRSASNSKPGPPVHPGAQPCGTTRTLLGCSSNGSQHHVPVPLRSTVVTRFHATTGTLTPTGPFAASRGSLIHVTRTSDHSVSNHLRFSARRVPLPQRRQHYFVRASPFHSPARQNRRPSRVHLVRGPGPCYGLLVHFQLLSTGGMAPAQLLSVTGLAMSVRSGTLTLLSKCALRRTSADFQSGVSRISNLQAVAPSREPRLVPRPADWKSATQQVTLRRIHRSRFTGTIGEPWWLMESLPIRWVAQGYSCWLECQ